MSDQDPGNEVTSAPMPSPAVGQKDLANAIRALTMDAVQQANSGHPGMPMGMADVATVLFSKVLKFDASQPHWPDRDRFVLSAGHGSMLLYALLYLTGYDDMTLDELKAFRRLGSKTAGHPEFGHASGIETTTGPLGQGISNAVGMALAERMLAARDKAGLVDHFTYVMAGDGCLMEGISHEAASLAGHLKLGRLILLFDDNGISIDGSTDLACSDDTLSRFRAYGWQTRVIDGHDPAAIEYALLEAKGDPRPSLIACKTVIGFGAPSKQGTAGVHGAPLGPDEIAAARAHLTWPYEPFVIPETILRAWRRAGTRGKAAFAAWQDRFKEQTKEALPVTWRDNLARFKEELSAKRPSLATRTSSQEALEVLTESIPNLIGGSADLTGSNNTKTAATKPVSAGNFDGRYIHYGVREHAMAAVMNGMALHKGLIPYGGTFLIFSDYARHAIRLSALMGVQVIYVMTHDSIGLGEDGPTHQPIEHLASLRAMPNLHVFRPADAVETAECWAASIEREDGPSLLALTRQSLPTLRLDYESGNLSAFGAYVLAEAKGPRAITLLATGSEVHLAMEAKERLDALGIAAAVVSLPCFELFEQQPADYRASVLGSVPCLAIEAGSPFGWTRYVDAESDVIGMTGFGASGPAPDLYVHFGITPEVIVAKAKAKLGLEEAA